MSTHTESTNTTGGEGMLFAIAAAIVLVVTAEAAFVAVGGWAAMCVVLGLVLVATVGVIAAVMRTIDSDDEPTLNAEVQ